MAAECEPFTRFFRSLLEGHQRGDDLQDTDPRVRCQSVLAVDGLSLCRQCAYEPEGEPAVRPGPKPGATPVMVTGRATRLTSLGQTPKWGDTRLNDSPIPVSWNRADQTPRPWPAR